MTASTSPDLLEPVIGAAGELSIRLHAGEVEIRAADGDAVRIHDLDGRDLHERFVIEASDGRLAIRPRDGFLVEFGLVFGGFGRGVNLAVEAPSGARLRIDSASAEIHATGFRGEQRYRTASGGIELEDVGGGIGVEAVSGDVAIRVAGEASLTARSVSGELTVDGGRLSSLGLSTTSGDVELRSELAGPGPFEVQTVSGDVSVASRGGLRVEAKTVTGEVSSDEADKGEFGRGQRVFTIGDGGTPFTPLSFKSISGDLHVRRQGSGTAAADTRATATSEPAVPEPDERGTLRLAILRELEAGTIDVEAASARLSELEEAD
jgi:putative adhesin